MALDLRQRDEERSAAEAARGSREKRRYVQAMFSDIAPRYDLLNHLLSFNLDRRWRRRAIDALDWRRDPAGAYLDLCAGTLDVAVALAAEPGFRGRVIGADFAEPMLRAGQAKVGGKPVLPVTADALALPLRDASCAGAIVAFGARNLASLDDGLREVARVLRSGGRYVILEFNTPRSPLFRFGYHLYFHRVLPRIGSAISGNPTAYTYLPQSVAHFPSMPALADSMRRAGFSEVTWRSMMFGVVGLHVGVKG
jgi:demethylmenaquinone methyltransferase / 2-methoxy-6-polyprenyl-1,4-benzoquinol methylase